MKDEEKKWRVLHWMVEISCASLLIPWWMMNLWCWISGVICVSHKIASLIRAQECYTCPPKWDSCRIGMSGNYSHSSMSLFWWWSTLLPFLRLSWHKTTNWLSLQLFFLAYAKLFWRTFKFLVMFCFIIILYSKYTTNRITMMVYCNVYGFIIAVSGS